MRAISGTDTQDRVGKPSRQDNGEAWGSRHDLWKAFSKARRAGLLTGPLSAYLSMLLDNVGYGLERPICYLTVEASCRKLAEEGGTPPDRSTVWRYNRKLEDLGLIIDKTPANGFRGRVGSVAMGIDLTPLFERRDELQALADAKANEQREAGELAAKIKSARGEITRYLRRAGESLSGEMRDLWESLPRRIRGQSIEALRRLLSAVQSLWNELISKSCGDADMQDACCKNEAQFTNTDKLKISGNYARHDDDGSVMTQSSRTTEKRSGKIERVALETLQAAVEKNQDLLEIADQYARSGPEGLKLLCEEMALHAGARRDILRQAQNRLGQAEFIALCMLLWGKSSRRPGVDHEMIGGSPIRDPNRWLWSMIGKTEAGRANLDRSLHGLNKSWRVEPA